MKIKAIYYVLCLATVMCLSACNHKELCYDHPHTATLTLAFDWQNAPDATPEGMCVYFYPLDGESSVQRYDFSGTKGGQLKVKEGKYRIICYNNDTEAVLFANIDNFLTHMGYTRESNVLEPVYGSSSVYTPKSLETTERVVLCPDMMWACHATDVEISENSVSYICAPVQDGDEVQFSNNERTITLYPAEIICTYTYEVRNVKNLKYATQMCGSLSGMAPSVLFYNEALDSECVTLPFSATSDGVSTITGKFYTFGHYAENIDPHKLLLYVWFTDGSKYYYTFDVSSQVDNAPDKRHVHIIIEGAEFPEPMGDGDGFDVGVDDWKPVEEDIIM